MAGIGTRRNDGLRGRHTPATWLINPLDRASCAAAMQSWRLTCRVTPRFYGGHETPAWSHSPMFDFDRVIERRGTHAVQVGHDGPALGHRCAGRDPDVGRGHGFRRPARRDRGADRRDRARDPRLLRRHRHLGGRAGGVDGAPPRLARGPGLGEPDARDRLRAGPDPAGGERARRRGRGVPARLSCLPPDHRCQRAAHSRCAAGRDRWPLRHGSRCAAREADAAHQVRVLLQPAQSGRDRVVGRRDPRAGRLLRRARPDPGVRRDPLRSRLRRRQAHAHA